MNRTIALLSAWTSPRLVLRCGEGTHFAWAFGYFFCLMCGYALLRPLRDQSGLAAGLDTLPWLFSTTFVVMLMAVPLFGWVVNRLPRCRAIPAVYHIFAVHLLLFAAAHGVLDARGEIARVFFVWVSVCNLFVVSVFWSVMAETFTPDQGKRLFGPIAAGGTLGVLVGPAITAAAVGVLGTVGLLVAAALLFEVAILCLRRLPARPRQACEPSPARLPSGAPDFQDDPRPQDGDVLTGARDVARDGYLRAIGAYILLFALTSTLLYFMQASIVADSVSGAAAQARVFALIDLGVGVLAVVLQLFAAARVCRRAGLARGLSVLPAVTAIGVSALAALPELAMLAAVQGTRRATNYTLGRPLREVLFTVLRPERLLKAKNFLDTVVYRGGDALGAWLFTGLAAAGAGLATAALVVLPLAGAWLAVGCWLGRRHERLAAQGEGS